MQAFPVANGGVHHDPLSPISSVQNARAKGKRLGRLPGVVDLEWLPTMKAGAV